MVATLLRYKYYLLTLALALIYIIAQSPYMHGDFKVFLAAADYLHHHTNPYNVWLIWKGQVTDRFYYGPLFACLLIPLTFIPEQPAFVIFFLLQTLLLMRAFTVIAQMLPVNKFTRKQKFLWWLLAVLCSLRFILHNVEFGQVTILILFLGVEGLYQVFYGNKIWGALLLGMGIHIKLLPLVFIPYLLWRREFLASGLCVVFAGAFWLTPFAFGNTAFTTQLFRDWWAAVSPVGERYIQHQEALGYQMQGLQALLAAYLLNSKIGDLGFKFNLVVLSQPVFQALLLATRLLFVFLTLYFLKGTFMQRYTKSAKDFWQLSYLFLVIPILFPQQQKYSLVLMAPLFCYMIWWLIAEKGTGKRWNIALTGFVLVVLLTTFTSDLFVGMRLNYVFQCLRILTMATIIAVPVLACARPVEDKQG